MLQTQKDLNQPCHVKNTHIKKRQPSHGHTAQKHTARSKSSAVDLSCRRQQNQRTQPGTMYQLEGAQGTLRRVHLFLHSALPH